MTEVAFLDADNKLTLTNTETVYGDGTKDILLSYSNIDLESLKINIEGADLIDYVVFNNVVVSPTPIRQGVKIDTSYKIKDSFIVDYNHDAKNDKALIKINTKHPMLKTVVIYETSDDPTRVASVIELNSIYNPVNEGFVYVSDEETYTTNLDVMINPKIIRTNENVGFYIKATDKKGSGVLGDVIILNVKYGRIEIKDNKTDKNGVVQAVYVAPNHLVPNDGEEISITDIHANTTSSCSNGYWPVHYTDWPSRS